MVKLGISMVNLEITMVKLLNEFVIYIMVSFPVISKVNDKELHLYS